MKTITISDEVYNKLCRLKGRKTFIEVINLLIQKNVEKRIDMLLESLDETGYEDDLEKISKSIRSNFQV